MYFLKGYNSKPVFKDEGTVNNSPAGGPPSSHTHPVLQISDSSVVGRNLVTAPDPGAIRFFRINADNTISELTDAQFRTAIGAGTSGLAIGTTAGTACEGNDPRLSDARTPTAHQLDGALHSVSGLTASHFLRALTSSTFGFQAMESQAVDAVLFDTSPTVIPVDGLTYWDDSEKTLSTALNIADGVTLQHGQELHVRVVNRTGVTIPNGSIVYALGAVGNRPSVGLADASDFTKCKGVAIATQDILNNHEGYCTRFGVVRDISTFGLGDASTLYLSATTPGAYTITPPSSPNFIINLGVTLNSTPNGSIYFRPYQTIATDTALLSPGTDVIPPSQLAVKTAINNIIAPWNTLATDTHFSSGFLNRTTSTLSLSTRTLSIAPTSGTFYIYLDGIKIAKTGGASCSTTIPATVGLHYVYFDATGTLQNSMTPWVIIDGLAPVATIYWNGSAGAVSDERHGAQRNLSWHQWAHDTISARYESGLAQTFPSPTESKIQIELGWIHDEDIEFYIAQQRVCRLWYETAAGVFTWANGTDNGGWDRPYIWNAGTSRVQYPKSDSAYALTDAGANQFVVVWVYAATDKDRSIYITTESKTTAYNNITAARAAVAPTTSGFLTPEMKLIYRWIFKGDGSYQETVDYRTSSPLPGGGTPAISALGVTYIPTGNIAATNVQNAIDELDTEKAAVNAATTGSAGSLKSTATTGLMTITGPAAGATRVVTIPDANATMARSDTGQTFTGTNAFVNNGTLLTEFQNTATTGSALIRIKSGNGTTSGKTNFFIAEALDATPQRWDMGMVGDNDWYLIDRTNSKNVMRAISNTGNVVFLNDVTATGYFIGKHKSSDGTAGANLTRTFYAASSSGGTVTVLNTVTIKDGLIVSWTQV